MPDSFLKDPNAVLNYMVDWADEEKGPWLATGEEISTSTWIVPAGITKTDESDTTTTATIWLSGGTVGESYLLTNRITTNQGRIDDRSFRIYVRER